MDSTRFNDYNALCNYISGLPPPKQGHVRVFRGQWKDFGNLRPTGVRNPLHNEHIWRQYCKMLATRMLMQEGFDFKESLSQASLWGYWYYAIVQHYGPGTHLLDVTHSLDVALWFALHKAYTDRRIDIRFEEPPVISQGPSLHRNDEWITYQEWREAPGVLYIFDVPDWNSTEIPGHGMLVDLAQAPKAFARSARIQAQKACLIAAVGHTCHGDLFKFLAHPPIEVGWPMTGCDMMNLTEAELFPKPQEDEWYENLLFLPVVHQVWDREPFWRMAHPVEISLYIKHLEYSIDAIQFKPLQPPLFFPWLIEYALRLNPTNIEAMEQARHFIGTVPILLEAPVFAEQAEYDIQSWNHAQLVENLPEVLGVIDWVSGEISDDPVLLTDVLFELSPLESIGWTQLLKENAEMHVFRAVHLVRTDEFSWQLQVFTQVAPLEKVGTLFKDFAEVRFDSYSTRLQIKDEAGWQDIISDPIASKSLFVAFMLLSALSPDPDSQKYFVESYKTALAVLKRAPDLGLGIQYYVMRNLKTNDPYTGEKV